MPTSILLLAGLSHLQGIIVIISRLLRRAVPTSMIIVCVVPLHLVTNLGLATILLKRVRGILVAILHHRPGTMTAMTDVRPLLATGLRRIPLRLVLDLGRHLVLLEAVTNSIGHLPGNVHQSVSLTFHSDIVV